MSGQLRLKIPKEEAVRRLKEHEPYTEVPVPSIERLATELADKHVAKGEGSSFFENWRDRVEKEGDSEKAMRLQICRDYCLLLEGKELAPQSQPPTKPQEAVEQAPAPQEAIRQIKPAPSPQITAPTLQEAVQKPASSPQITAPTAQEAIQVPTAAPQIAAPAPQETGPVPLPRKVLKGEYKEMDHISLPLVPYAAQQGVYLGIPLTVGWHEFCHAFADYLFTGGVGSIHVDWNYPEKGGFYVNYDTSCYLDLKETGEIVNPYTHKHETVALENHHHSLTWPGNALGHGPQANVHFGPDNSAPGVDPSMKGMVNSVDGGVIGITVKDPSNPHNGWMTMLDSKDAVVTPYNAYYAMVAAGTVGNDVLSLMLFYPAFKLRKRHPVASGFLLGASVTNWANSFTYPLSHWGDWKGLGSAFPGSPEAAAVIFGASLPALAALLIYRENKRERKPMEEEALGSLVERGIITREMITSAWERYPLREGGMQSLADATAALREAKKSEKAGKKVKKSLKKLNGENERFVEYLRVYFAEEIDSELGRQQAGTPSKKAWGAILRRMPQSSTRGERAHVEMMLADGEGNSFGVDREGGLVAVSDAKGNAVRFKKSGAVDYAFSEGCRLFYDAAGRPMSVRNGKGKKLKAGSSGFEAERARLEALLPALGALKESATKERLGQLGVEKVNCRLEALAQEIGGSDLDMRPFALVFEAARKFLREGDFVRAGKLVEVAAGMAHEPYLVDFLVFSKKRGPYAGPRPAPLEEMKESKAKELFAERIYKGDFLWKFFYSVKTALAREGVRQFEQGDKKTALCLASIIASLDKDEELGMRIDAFAKAGES